MALTNCPRTRPTDRSQKRCANAVKERPGASLSDSSVVKNLTKDNPKFGGERWKREFVAKWNRLGVVAL